MDYAMDTADGYEKKKKNPPSCPMEGSMVALTEDALDTSTLAARFWRKICWLVDPV